MVQTGAAQLPTEGTTPFTVYPAGIASFTVTPVAALGPRLVAVMRKVMALPTGGFGLLTVFTTPRSASGTGMVVSVSVLLTGSGSFCAPEATAVFAYGPVAFTVAVI